MYKALLSVLLTILLFGCSSSEITTDQSNKKEAEVYVFDDIPTQDSTSLTKPFTVKKDTIEKVEQEPIAETILKKFTVQVGAFTSKERAESFIKENQSKTSFLLTVTFIAQNQLFAVQIPPYNTKEEADKIRDVLKKFPAFKDAFTVLTEYK